MTVQDVFEKLQVVSVSIGAAKIGDGWHTWVVWHRANGETIESELCHRNHAKPTFEEAVQARREIYENHGLPVEVLPL